jgi:ABC-type multidrug transport system ATPase subunit
MIEKVLSDLSIRHIGDTIIGGSRETQAAANISGGQLKRVNIACELVALSHPAALLLDEPTSGLDASIAYGLIESLEVIAATGITVLMALQQPRPEIFARMDRVVLMLNGGHIVYDGPPSEAAGYLQSKVSINTGTIIMMWQLFFGSFRSF